ncbi:copper amine oxidase N-terminal domain-containing protein [bacterium]|nr:MAG: copper amine oxidase N-terminal domain-containing protein [bacterium]
MTILRGACALLLACTLLGASTTPSVLVDDHLLATDPQPQVQSGRVLLPMRAIFEALGARVEYDGAHHAVIATGSAREIYLPIGARYAFVDGKRVTLDVGSAVERGRTLVPLRFVAESLGASVVYIAQANLVAIHRASSNEVAAGTPSATPYPQAPPYAPTAIAPPLQNPAPYPDNARTNVYPFLPADAQGANGLFFGVIGIPGGWGYFSVPGMEGQFPLMPWPGVPGRYYGVISVPLISAAALVNVYGRFYTSQGLSQTFSLAVPLGTGAAAPLIFAIPIPTPAPAKAAAPMPAPYRTALPPLRRPVATPTPAQRHLLGNPPPRRPAPRPTRTPTPAL